MTIKTLDNKNFLCFIGETYLGVATKVKYDNWTVECFDGLKIEKILSMSDATRRIKNHAVVAFM